MEVGALDQWEGIWLPKSYRLQFSSVSKNKADSEVESMLYLT